ncbi:Hopanoid-associated sugar epimerase [Parasponia andersonii]|uniref:Hopanoid-associated sugar epimerase n=1 Tax=Parasponia andersonii TaxID=3476 RepID=A0A2P5DDP9_PARAD|nr:Hopanoid-associated sugar epimerase [Parasponia andersonii]
MAKKSKILVIKGTGYFGKFLVKARAEASHPTFALVRESTVSNPEKLDLFESFKSSGVTLLYVSTKLYVLPQLGQPNGKVPPRDQVVVLGDGNRKGVFVEEEDIATYTIKAVEDPRTLNKTLFVRPPANILSFNEIVSIRENKNGKTLEKTYVLEDQSVKTQISQG